VAWLRVSSDCCDDVVLFGRVEGVSDLGGMSDWMQDTDLIKTLTWLGCG
jgi:hypothetical protein